MKKVILITMSVVALMMSACAEKSNVKGRSIVSQDTPIDCSNLENNQVQGLAETYEGDINTPKHVQSRISSYINESRKYQDQASIDYFLKNAEYEQTILNAFLVKFNNVCQ
jgi:hypothetical protein